MDPISIFRTAFMRSGKRGAPAPTAPHAPTPEQLAFFRDFIDEGALVFDVGSNTGDKAAIFLELGAQVVAFEPQPDCARIMVERFRGNPGIEVVQAGLADKAGNLRMNICRDASTLSTFSSDWKEGRFKDRQWDDEITVPVMTLDAAIERFGTPDFVKIDVEGFEEQVIRGLSQATRRLSFEFAREFMDKTVRCLQLLGSIGFREFNIALGEDTELRCVEWTTDRAILAFIDGSDDQLLWGDIYARALE